MKAPLESRSLYPKLSKWIFLFLSPKSLGRNSHLALIETFYWQLYALKMVIVDFLHFFTYYFKLKCNNSVLE